MTYKEIEEMILTVDKNGDGKISYSEFRVMMGAQPLLHVLAQSKEMFWTCKKLFFSLNFFRLKRSFKNQYKALSGWGDETMIFKQEDNLP